MAKRIKENLDYTFEWRDAIAIDRMMKSYINDRENLYAELFNSDEDFDKEDVIEYVDYFLSLNCKHQLLVYFSFLFFLFFRQ